MEKLPAVVDSATLHTGDFIALRKLRWRDRKGVERHWESAERVNDAGAVLIIARLMPSDRFILIRQYRPPARRDMIEFPAGLMDAGETPEHAAARELREETGYVARELHVLPAAFTTPGLSNESVFLIRADIDEAAPENKNPRTEFDSSEDIETILVPRGELVDFYRREAARGVSFDAKVASFALYMMMLGEWHGDRTSPV